MGLFAESLSVILFFVVYCAVEVVARRRLASELFAGTNAGAAFADTDIDIERIRTRRDLNATQLLFSRRRLQQARSPEDHRVKNLPGLSSSAKLVHYAGHLPVNEANTGYLFYWLFEAANNADQAPLLIWLNGGPGCSSMDGLFIELGPLRLDGDKRTNIKINPDSWHNSANLLFIDQPVGTGFAYTKNKAYCSNDDQINTQFLYFLEKFFQLHKGFTKTQGNQLTTRSLFLSGESHAGHYIPNMANAMVKHNTEKKNAGRNSLIFNLVGIALGNPWMDPPNQYDASEVSYGLGLISSTQLNLLKEQDKDCQARLRSGNLNQPTCTRLLDEVIASTGTGSSHKTLMYDARRFVPSSSVFPPGHEAVEAYLNNPDVRLAIHATDNPSQRFVECADPPYNALAHQDGKGVTGELVNVLEAGVRVLVFVGVYDLVCNHIGVEKALDALPWSGRLNFLDAQPGVWIQQGKTPAGYVRQYKNLQYLRVLQSGHMVPMDQPQVALAMITNFLKDLPFMTSGSGVGTRRSPPDCVSESAPQRLTQQVSPSPKHAAQSQDSTQNSYQVPSTPAAGKRTVQIRGRPSVVIQRQFGDEPYNASEPVVVISPKTSISSISSNNKGGIENINLANAILLSDSVLDDLCRPKELESLYCEVSVRMVLGPFLDIPQPDTKQHPTFATAHAAYVSSVESLLCQDIKWAVGKDNAEVFGDTPSPYGRIGSLVVTCDTVETKSIDVDEQPVLVLHVDVVIGGKRKEVMYTLQTLAQQTTQANSNVRRGLIAGSLQPELMIQRHQRSASSTLRERSRLAYLVDNTEALQWPGSALLMRENGLVAILSMLVVFMAVYSCLYRSTKRLESKHAAGRAL